MRLSQKRLRFDGAAVTQEGDNKCRVALSFTFTGRLIQTSALGSDDGDGRLKASAVAALLAVEQAVEGRFACRLVDLDHVNALGKDLIAVLVDVDFEGKEVQVFGSCGLQDSEIDTAVKAALNATNRLFELSMRDDTP